METKWWANYPWRNIQTNLREIDMEDMDAKKYVSQLRDLGATVTLLNAAGMMASYETKLDFQPMSSYLHGSSLEEIVAECHKENIKVFCRTDFSKIRQDIYEKHPDWAFRTTEGEVVNSNGYIAACINGDYQKIYIHKILEEVLTTIPFDGVFFNMGGFMVTDYDCNYQGICHCDSCKKMFRQRFNEELPDKMQPGNPSMIKYMSFKAQCEKEHKERLVKTVRSINPDIAIAGSDYVRSETSTDNFRHGWPYGASSNSRKNQLPDRSRIADNNGVAFLGFHYRDTAPSPALMELLQWQNLANSGNCSVFTMGHLGNRKDMSWYEGVKKVFDFHHQYEELYSFMANAASVGVIRPGGFEMGQETDGWIRALTQAHIPFDEIQIDEISTQLDGKKLLILCNLSLMSDEAVAAIDQFVKEGGVVIATGETSCMNDNFSPRKGFGLECLGVTMAGRSEKLKSTVFEITEDEMSVFPRCASAPYIIPGASMTKVKCSDTVRTYMRMIPEHPYGPPELAYVREVSDVPGVYENFYGKGKGIYIPFSVGEFYARCGYQNSLSFIQDVIEHIAGIPSVAPDLTPMVELNLSKSQGKTIIHLVNETGCFDIHYFPPVKVMDITICLSLDDLATDDTQNNISARLENIKALNGGTVSATHQNHQVVIHLNQLDNYEAIVL